MKHIHVACAIIEIGGKVLCTQRSEVMSLPMKWEFPGGKIDEGESPGECLKRELREELGIDASVGQPLQQTTHHYSLFTVTLYPFICEIISGEITLHEHCRKKNCISSIGQRLTGRLLRSIRSRLIALMPELGPKKWKIGD